MNVFAACAGAIAIMKKEKIGRIGREYKRKRVKKIFCERCGGEAHKVQYGEHGYRWHCSKDDAGEIVCGWRSVIQREL